MDDFLHNLRNSKNKTFDRNRKPYDNPNFKGTDRKNGKDRKNEDLQRIITPERIAFVTRFMDDLLNTQKQLAEMAEKRLVVEERIASVLERMLLDQQAAIQSPFIPEVSRNEVVNAATTSSVDSTDEQQEYNSRNKVIDLIFQLHNEGFSHGQIVDRLKELEIPTFTGKGDWRIQTIAKFCKDMASTGNTKLNAESDE